MPAAEPSVVVIGGGVVGCAVAFTLAHRDVAVTLLEAESELGLQASGTNSGMLHSGFDSTPGELETQLILRSGLLREPVLEALGIPTLRCGAVLEPKNDDERDVVRQLAANAARNGVDAQIRPSDGALVVPGEWVTDPVAYTTTLARSAEAAGAQILTDARVIGLAPRDDGVTIRLEDGRELTAAAAVNCGGLFADDIARLWGDDSFEIYPRKGEFFVFDPAEPGPVDQLDHIVLPAPTKRTKGVLVFPTLDGNIVAGPTAHDQIDKRDWSVRTEARDEVLTKAAIQHPPLAGAEPVFAYAGLRPAGRDTNYVIGPSSNCARAINVAAIRSTGLSASLGIGEYVAGLVASLGIAMAPQRPPVVPTPAPAPAQPWWQRTAQHHVQQQQVEG